MGDARPPRTPPRFDFDRLATEMTRRGWTTAQLARACPSIRRDRINATVNGGLPPSPRVRLALEAALGMTLTRES